MNTKNSPPQPVFDEFQLKVFESNQKIKRLVLDLTKDPQNASGIDLKTADTIFQKYPYVTMKDLHRSKRTFQSIIEEVMTKRICEEALKH